MEEIDYCMKYDCSEDCSDIWDTFFTPVFCVPVVSLKKMGSALPWM